MKECKDLGSNRATLVGQWAEVSPAELKPAKRQTRSHPKSKKRILRTSIEANGIVAPIIVNSEYEIVDGHLRVEIAIELSLPAVPVIRVSHMSEAELKALAIAANRMSYQWQRSPQTQAEAHPYPTSRLRATSESER